ncbi:MAG: hypothetical protein KKA55_12675 [Proteobacteria bacterium]|nr:hypothetical protein [Pseudomonadota bacterium]MBU1596372.1 hypothetical protein [Pseudomonadota bacterium]
MSKAWIRAKLPEFVRDMFRTFCMAAKALEEQFRAFDREGAVAFTVLRDLVGQEMDKGLLWRMKDTAHHVFRNDPETPLTGQFLDWGLGYIFHETIKLKEDAYQALTYAPWFLALRGRDLPEAERVVVEELFQVLKQTEESMRREIDRIRFIIFQCRRLLPLYLSRHRENALLARYLFSQNALVREVFGNDYDLLVTSIYGDHPERMYVLAAQSLRLGGWVVEASQAVQSAFAINSTDRLVLQEKKVLENWSARMAP